MAPPPLVLDELEHVLAVLLAGGVVIHGATEECGVGAREDLVGEETAPHVDDPGAGHL